MAFSRLGIGVLCVEFVLSGSSPVNFLLGLFGQQIGGCQMAVRSDFHLDIAGILLPHMELS